MESKKEEVLRLAPLKKQYTEIEPDDLLLNETENLITPDFIKQVEKGIFLINIMPSLRKLIFPCLKYLELMNESLENLRNIEKNMEKNDWKFNSSIPSKNRPWSMTDN